MYQRTVKKFGTSSKAWTLFGEYYLRNGKVEEARALLPRSLKSLERRKRQYLLPMLPCRTLTRLLSDLKVISKFAQMEYRHGDPERGKTIFEGIVDSHPKRLDLWAVYIDQEAKQGNLDAARYACNPSCSTVGADYVPPAFCSTASSVKSCLRRKPSKRCSCRSLLSVSLIYLSRFIFKKWLEVEKKIGPEQGVEAVKTRAIEWTQLNGIGGDM